MSAEFPQATLTTSPGTASGGLPEALAAEHRRIRAAFRRAAAARTHRERCCLLSEGIAYACQHIGAVRHTLHPACNRRVGPADGMLAGEARLIRRMSLGLRALEQQVNGDMLARATPTARLVGDLLDLLEIHARQEAELTARLVGGLTGGEEDELVARIHRAARRAPTRPHPYLPHSPALARMVVALEAAVDRVRDGFDSRPLPSDRRPAGRPAGKWGCYVLGVAIPQPRQSPEG